jgi:outer membrane protein assembly factor BamB
LIVAVQLAGLVLQIIPEIKNSSRFGIMIGVPALCLLMFTAWLLFGSRIPWTSRFGLLAAVGGGGLVAGLGAHATMHVAMWIYGVPLAMFLCVAGLSNLFRQEPSRRLTTAASLVLAGWALFPLGRLEGFDGAYLPSLSFRWTATADSRLDSTATRIVEGEVEAATADSGKPTAAAASEPRDDSSATSPMANAGAVPEPSQSTEPSSRDWPGFRGALRDGHARLATSWAKWQDAKPRELWRRPIGAGWSSFCCVGRRLFTQEQRGENEMVVCYDSESGKERWRQASPSRFSDVVSGAGPRGTPTYHQGKLYTLGGRGLLSCLDATTGDLIWQRDLMAEIDAQLPVWGFSSSPLIAGDAAIVFAGGSEDRGWVGYGLADGAPRWHRPGSAMNFSSAQRLASPAGELVLLSNMKRLDAVAAVDGVPAWSHNLAGDAGMTIVQPQPLDDGRIVLPRGDGAGVALIEPRLADGAWSIAEHWDSADLRPSFNDYVHHGGHLYGFSQNLFVCVDATTGRKRWKQGRYGFGQVVLMADGQGGQGGQGGDGGEGVLVVLAETGEVVVLAADPQRHRELTRFPGVSGKTWNHPAIADGKLFIRNSEEAACFELP